MRAVRVLLAVVIGSACVQRGDDFVEIRVVPQSAAARDVHSTRGAVVVTVVWEVWGMGGGVG